MDYQIILGFGAIVITVLIYFAHKEYSTNKNINEIATKYLQLDTEANDNLHLYSLDLLIKAGVMVLKNTKDKRKVFEQIKLRGKGNTFQWYEDLINKTDKELEKLLIAKNDLMNAS